jgi:hypothetical protein
VQGSGLQSRNNQAAPLLVLAVLPVHHHNILARVSAAGPVGPITPTGCELSAHVALMFVSPALGLWLCIGMAMGAHPGNAMPPSPVLAGESHLDYFSPQSSLHMLRSAQASFSFLFVTHKAMLLDAG